MCPICGSRCAFEADHADRDHGCRVGASARVAHVEFGDDYSRASHGRRARTSRSTRASIRRSRATPIHTRRRLGAHRASNPAAPDAAMTDARGYVGIGGSAVLALRGQLARSDSAAPAGRAVAARRRATRCAAIEPGIAPATASRRSPRKCGVPLNSPLSVSQFGVKASSMPARCGTRATRLADQRFERGIGGGVFIGAAVVDAESRHRVARGREARACTSDWGSVSRRRMRRAMQQFRARASPLCRRRSARRRSCAP